MRKQLTFVLIIILTPFYILTAGEMELEGIYKGENLYIENPYTETGIGFCVYEVTVNGFSTTDEINSSFFEIDLSVYNFTFGDLLFIVLKHRDGCVPKVLNKEVIVPVSTFEINSITIDDTGFLKWSTSKEKGSLPFVIEQFRWNKWVRVGSVKGKGTNTLNYYSYNVDFHSGKNKFRIKQIDASNKPRYSASVELYSNIPENHFVPGNGNKVNDVILFSYKTRYEIYDFYGKLVKTGSDQDINTKDLGSGTYFLNYDNKTETFIVK